MFSESLATRQNYPDVKHLNHVLNLNWLHACSSLLHLLPTLPLSEVEEVVFLFLDIESNNYFPKIIFHLCKIIVLWCLVYIRRNVCFRIIISLITKEFSTKYNKLVNRKIKFLLYINYKKHFSAVLFPLTLNDVFNFPFFFLFHFMVINILKYY